MRILKILLSLSIILIPACMGPPYNGQELNSITEEVLFGGYVTTPSQAIGVQILDPAGGTPLPLGFFTSAATGGGDGVTTKLWYPWGGKRILNYPRYWSQSDPSDRRLSLQLKPSIGDASLATFDRSSEAEECIRSTTKDGLWAIIQNCHSDDSPVVTLFVQCGKVEKPCCKVGNPCDETLSCDANSQTCMGLMTVASGLLQTQGPPEFWFEWLEAGCNLAEKNTWFEDFMDVPPELSYSMYRVRWHAKNVAQVDDSCNHVDLQGPVPEIGESDWQWHSAYTSSASTKKCLLTITGTDGSVVQQDYTYWCK